VKKKEFYNETPSRHKTLGTGAGAGGACTEKIEQMLLYVCTLCVERLPCIRYLPHDGGAGMGKRKARDPSSIRGYRIEAMGVGAQAMQQPQPCPHPAGCSGIVPPGSTTPVTSSNGTIGPAAGQESLPWHRS